MNITLCGSAKFEPLFHTLNLVLTLNGHVVHGMSAYPSVMGDKSFYTPEQKARLDEMHLRKIDASHAIVVINHGAYIGESTLKEVRYAWSQRRHIIALESWGEGCGSGSYGSPIDTSVFPSIYDGDLIGSAPDRSLYADMIKEAERECAFHQARVAVREERLKQLRGDNGILHDMREHTPLELAVAASGILTDHLHDRDVPAWVMSLREKFPAWNDRIRIGAALAQAALDLKEFRPWADANAVKVLHGDAWRRG